MQLDKTVDEDGWVHVLTRTWSCWTDKTKASLSLGPKSPIVSFRLISSIKSSSSSSSTKRSSSCFCCSFICCYYPSSYRRCRSSSHFFCCFCCCCCLSVLGKAVIKSILLPNAMKSFSVLNKTVLQGQAHVDELTDHTAKYDHQSFDVVLLHYQVKHHHMQGNAYAIHAHHCNA